MAYDLLKMKLEAGA